MPGPRPEPIDLTPRQRKLLEAIVRKAKSQQRTARRALIILGCAQGLNNHQIATKMGITRDIVRTWRGRWLSETERLCATEAEGDDQSLARLVELVLDDAPRLGRPPTFSEKQIVDIVALACEDPKDSGRPISFWTPRELAEEAQKRKIVKSISTRSAGRFLKRGRFEASSQSILAKRQHRRSGGV